MVVTEIGNGIYKTIQRESEKERIRMYRKTIQRDIDQRDIERQGEREREREGEKWSDRENEGQWREEEM